jgi:hypothetical protein
MKYFLIVMALIIALRILQSLFRSREEEPARKQPRSRRSDLDRFLEEIERRRRQTEERRGMEPVSEVPTAVEPVRPRPSVSPPRPAPPVHRPVPATIPPPQVQPVILDVVPVREVQPSVTSPAPTAVPVPPPVPIHAIRTTRTPAVQPPVRALLRSPQSLRTAFILREVFGPPLCRRNKRGR